MQQFIGAIGGTAGPQQDWGLVGLLQQPDDFSGHESFCDWIPQGSRFEAEDTGPSCLQMSAIVSCVSTSVMLLEAAIVIVAGEGGVVESGLLSD